MMIHVQDCREVGYCMKSVRPWFERHGLDWQKFVREGITAERLLATEDEYARQIVEHVRKREAADGR
jgi:hypothetical protein